MESMIFQVSAKTARLIGRENISDVDGAIIELVKNGYDADAECVYVKYVNPYNQIPQKLTLTEVKDYFSGNMELIKTNYQIKNGKYVLMGEPENDEEKEQRTKNLLQLEIYLKSLSKIIVLDNGIGMSKKVLQTSWMNIGTDDKEINIYSKKKNRIKTGAKGIGRFALDKLSLKTRVLTKSENDEGYEWNIDWTQFDQAKLLNQVNASMDVVKESFEQLVKEYLGKDYELVKDNSWKTGTLIELSPIRDFWDEKLYKKVNSNLQNINPLGSVDKFNIIVRNEKYPKLDFISKSEEITKDNYDYLVEANFDGQGNVTISFDRNEIDIRKNSIEIAYSANDVEMYDLDEFWGRKAFTREKYKRKNFDGKQTFMYTLNEIIEGGCKEAEKYNKVGPFSFKMYYLKNQNSTVQIVKDFKSRKRKQLVNDFSGIKIYRDDFKVRPYGDYGQFYDWINLSERVQKSPAAASHESGNWRVSPNQVIGSVSISRIQNPKLEDSANREGMNLNREYDYFIEIIQGIISKFEYDRQYVLREFAAWERDKKKAHTTKVQQIYEQVMKEKEKENKISKVKEGEVQEKSNEESEESYSEEELKDVIYALGKEKEYKISREQLMMVLSASGVLAQTFAHEITRIGTELGSRGQHLKAAINRILDYKPYMGDEDFNPYDMLDELNETDELLAEWVGLIMDSISKEKFVIKNVQLKEFLDYIERKWFQLLAKKYISIKSIECDENIVLKLPEVDLHLIINNFILNSAYFLEEAPGERWIFFKVYEDETQIHMEMSNNGPELDEKYRQNPDETLNALVSSKEGGTGLGLWIAREATERNSGELHVILVDKGYMLRASWRK